MLLVKDKFLVKDTRHKMTSLVFTYEDPRNVGYTGVVDEGVSLDYDMDAVHRWPEGTDAPQVCVGQDPDDPKHYKVFKYEKDRQAEGYLPIPGTAVVFGSWNDYRKLVPPRPSDENWFDYLDNLDEDWRHYRQLGDPHRQLGDPPKSGSRDEIAAWVAKKHLSVDTSIREIWYLPHGAPLEEIRLLEVSDRLLSNGPVEAIEFGLNIENAPFRLLVADITTDQLEQIQQNASLLPKEWMLDDNRIFRRREA